MTKSNWQKATEFMNEPRVLIGVSSADLMRYGAFFQHLNMLIAAAPPNTVLTHTCGQSPARNRNVIIDCAIENNFTHIYFLDDDLVFKPDVLARLLKHDLDFVIGHYKMRAAPFQSIVFDGRDDATGMHKWMKLNGDSGLVKVSACGAGGLLVKTSIFEKLEKPYFTLGQIQKDHWCDDIDFCNRCDSAGIEMYCDLNTPYGHISTCVLWPEFKDGKWGTALSLDTLGFSLPIEGY